MTKIQLVERMLESEASVEQVASALRLTKTELVRSILRADARDRAARRRPCPKGHKPGDPKCDLMCQISTVEPVFLPIFAGKTRMSKSPHSLHSWTQDELTPVSGPTVPVSEAAPTTLPEKSSETAREFILDTYDKESLRKVMSLHIDTSMVNWQEFGRRFTELTAQFAPLPKPKHHWWERIPYSWGWFWRVPWGWWCKVWRAFERWVEINALLAMVGTGEFTDRQIDEACDRLRGMWNERN